MFIQIWNKYLPVIRILLKRSVNGQQTLQADKSDFQRAAGGKKIKFTFSILVTKNRASAKESSPQIIKDFLAVIQQDSITSEILRKSEVEFSMNSSFQLLIKNNSLALEPTLSEEPNQEEPAPDNGS